MAAGGHKPGVSRPEEVHLPQDWGPAGSIVGTVDDDLWAWIQPALEVLNHVVNTRGLEVLNDVMNNRGGDGVPVQVL